MRQLPLLAEGRALGTDAISKTCRWCERPFTRRSNHQQYCSVRCRNRKNYHASIDYRRRHRAESNARVRANRAKNPFSRRLTTLRQRTGARITQYDLRALMREQCGLCALCGDPLTVLWHVDHIQPAGLGGPTVLGNLQLTCKPCNVGKWTYTVEAYVEHCRKVVLHAERQRL